MAAVRRHHDQLMKEMLASTKGRLSRPDVEVIATRPAAASSLAGKAPQSSTQVGSDSSRQASTKLRTDGVAAYKVQRSVSYAAAEPQERLQTSAQPQSSSKGQQRAVSFESSSAGVTAFKRSPPEVLQSQLTIATAVAVRLGPRPYTPPNMATCDDNSGTHSMGLRSPPASFGVTSKPTPKAQTDDALFTAIPVITSPTGKLIGPDRRSVSQIRLNENGIQDWHNGVNGSAQKREIELSSVATKVASLPRAGSKDKHTNGSLPLASTEATPVYLSRPSAALQQREQPISPRSVNTSSTSPGSRHSLPRQNGWSWSAASSKESPLSPKSVSAVSPAYQEHSPRYGTASPDVSSSSTTSPKAHMSRGSSWSDSSPGTGSKSPLGLTQRQQGFPRSVSCQTNNLDNLDRQMSDETSWQRNGPARTVSSPSWSQLQRQQCVDVDLQLQPEETRVSVSALIEEFNCLSPVHDQDQQSPQPLDARYSPRGSAQSQLDEKPNGRQKNATAVAADSSKSPMNRPVLGGSGKEPEVHAVREEARTYNRTAFTMPTSPDKKDVLGALQVQGKQQKQPVSSIVAIREGTSSSSRSADAQDGLAVSRRGRHSPRLNFDVPNDAKILGVCAVCNETIAANLGGCMSMGKKYHISCLVCCRCGKELAEQTFYTIEGNPHCRDCFASTLEKCSSCQEVITGKLLRAAGKVYHLSCFVCAVCNRSLEGQQFVLSPHNEPLCVKDYYETYAPRCDGCYRPIIPDEGEESALQVRVFDRCFHVACCKCEMCGKVILSQPSQEAACYPLNGRLVCKACGLSRVSTSSYRLP